MKASPAPAGHRTSLVQLYVMTSAIRKPRKGRRSSVWHPSWRRREVCTVRWSVTVVCDAPRPGCVLWDRGTGQRSRQAWKGRSHCGVIHCAAVRPCSVHLTDATPPMLILSGVTAKKGWSMCVESAKCGGWYDSGVRSS